MIQILSRLPATSLIRFKCVSKLWSSLIRSRYFSNLYLTVASPSRPKLRLYMSLVEHYQCDSMELCRNPGKSELLSLTLTSSSISAESSFEPNITFPGMRGHEMVVLRGLILHTVCRKACIYNPATRQSLTLPAVKSNIFAQQERYKHVNYFFGHDPVHDQYKIVCSVVVFSEVRRKITSESWVFVLEPRGFWKRIVYDVQPHLPTRQGLCINGVIYYLAFNHTCRDNVYCFDVRSEEFRVIQGPHEVSKYAGFLGFIEHGGKPAIFDFTHIKETGLSELWALEVDSGTWSRKSLVLKPCQRHLVDDIINIMDLRVRGTGQGNEVILALPGPCYLLYYDLIKNDLRKVNIIKEMPTDHTPYMYVKVMDMPESIMHLKI
ncbi:putative F-box protein [Raphanus sativus]|nr:putative F-box protein [Raphanus sativus]